MRVRVRNIPIQCPHPQAPHIAHRVSYPHPTGVCLHQRIHAFQHIRSECLPILILRETAVPAPHEIRHSLVQVINPVRGPVRHLRNIRGH